jgi:hypothetical protein
MCSLGLSTKPNIQVQTSEVQKNIFKYILSYMFHEMAKKFKELRFPATKGDIMPT